MSNRLPFSEPSPSGSRRAREAKRQRDLATEVERLRPHAITQANGEELEHSRAPNTPRVFPANFTKGLKHDGNGLLADRDHYQQFVEAINSPQQTLFENNVTTAIDVEPDATVLFRCTRPDSENNQETPTWRGWESPRSGHVFDLQGPDAGAVGMAPAPRVASSELVAEMAEVYAMAILRDVPFSEIAKGKGETIQGTNAELDGDQAAQLLSGLPYFTGTNVRSSTPGRTINGLNGYERNRLESRNLSGPITPEMLFRGSTPGSQIGPYISQFMLAGNDSRAGTVSGTPSFPGRDARFDAEDGFIVYGTQIVDQRSVVHKAGIDHMTGWNHWLDVNNGANLGSGNSWEEDRRFITTPRDLASYVHFDALYQAYLNAALLLLSANVPTSRGFPEPSPSGRRTAFATFGGPHILSLVTEVATRCLKAVRRQKFNYHRRARPEALAARLALAYGVDSMDLANILGLSADDYSAAVDELPEDLKKAVIDHNKQQNSAAVIAERRIKCANLGRPDAFSSKAAWAKSNLLLPMAFPEGSPMHPAYGAGHATVAGGCVTMLKAFFDMYEDERGEKERILDLDGQQSVFEPTNNGRKLRRVNTGPLTIQGELDKLAANISIGRNMAGVHYFSDYYDSIRMGERITIGILLEQMPTYVEAVEMMFESFDGDLITITGEGGSAPSLSICSKGGDPVSPRDWWLRHVPGEEVIEDLFLQP
ncbi:MAG: bromoperoxidase [Pseudomonadota bacterium]